MKVLHVIDSGGLYGAEMMLLSLLAEQKKLAIDAEVISIGLPGESEKAIEKELKLRNFVVHPLRMSKFPRISQGVAILKLCTSVGANIIHSHGYKGNILLGILPKWIRKIPVITTLHGYTQHKFLSKMTVYQCVDKLVSKLLDAIVLVSPTLMAQINQFGTRKKVHIVYNGIPLLDDEVSSCVKDSNIYLIGSIGRLSKEKNFAFLIAMMPEVLRIIPQAKLIIHGEGEERAKLEHQIRCLGLENCISMPGYIKNPHNFLNKIDLYVNCSFTEGMPITLLEAMRARSLMLASNIPANKLLLDGDYALKPLFDLTNNSFLEGLRAHCLAPSYIKNDQKNKFYNLFYDSYTSVAMAKKYKEIYEDVSW